jgi:voltage-gated potassium channel
MNGLKRRMLLAVVLLVLVVAFGTTGYMIIERWNFLDSLYMTIITVTTVGYREIHDLSTSGIIFTMILIVGGVGTGLVVLGTGATMILEGELQEIFGRKRLERKIKELHNHHIICGYGRMGKIISRELKEAGMKFVVIEKSHEMIEENNDVLAVEGDATKDSMLKQAGIERAKGLISVLSSDAENLFVVLSARVLNPNLFIVARAVDEAAEKKLHRAGADKVVSPYHIGGLRMAYTVLKPAVVEFIEFATKTGNIELRLEEVVIVEGSDLIGSSLDECGIGRDLGIIIVAIKRPSGEMRFNPTSRSIIKAEDILIAIGEASRLKVLEDMAGGKAKHS